MFSAVRIKEVSRSDLAYAAEAMAEVKTLFASSCETLYRARNEIRQVDYAGQRLVIKSFKVPSFLNRFVYGRFRKSKAQRSYDNSQKLQQLGICTPTPVGYQEYYQGALLAESFYVSVLHEPRYRLEQVLHGDPVPEREAILAALGRFVGELHKCGVLHRDLSPGNILIRDINGKFDFCLVDTNRMTFGPLDLTQRMRNFAMLWATDQDLGIIVSAYAQATGLHSETVCQMALVASQAHKARSARKERLKRWLGR